MKPTFLLLLAMLCFSCTHDEDENVPTLNVATKKTEKSILVDIVYVLPSQISFEETLPSSINSTDYINYLNDHYFYQYNIGLIMGTTTTIKNDELFDLRDNRGDEVSTFLNETKNIFHKNRLTIYIIKRSNIIAIAGIGKDQRALITDENLYTSTTPHEIGHALGLFHSHEGGNVMHDIKTHPRHSFDAEQVAHMKETIDQIRNRD